MKKFIPFLLLATIILSSCGPRQIQKVEASNGVNIEQGEVLDYDNAFIDNFDNGLDSSKWDISKRVWGQNWTSKRYNGGVLPNNVSYEPGVLRLHAKGNYYAKHEFNGLGEIKDGSSTGAAIVLKQNVRPGRYEVKMKIAPRVGICSTMWLYTEDKSIQNPGKKAQNHEIDIELPTKINNEIDFNNVFFTNYTAENKHKQTKKELPFNVNDGQYHTYGFDWYYSDAHKLINYYIDDVVYATHTDLATMPFLTNKLWLGVWIPNNANFVGNAKFDESYMEIDSFKYTPFKNQINKDYPGHNPSQGQRFAAANEFPKQPRKITNMNYYPNGDFEYAGVINQQHSEIGLEFDPNKVIINAENGLNSYGAKINNSNINTQIDSTYGGDNLDVKLDYKGEGQLALEYFDKTNVSLGKDIINLSSRDWTSLKNKTFKIKDNAYYTNVTISSNSILNVDNILVGKNFIKDEEIIPPIVTESSNVGISILDNKNLPLNVDTNKGIQRIKFDGKNDWVVSNSFKDDHQKLNFMLGSSYGSALDNPMSSIHLMQGNSPELNTLKNIDKVMETYCGNGRQYTQAMYMDYDIKDFTDISIYIDRYYLSKGEAATSWNKNVILYSIDQGKTWQGLGQNMLKNASSNNTYGINSYELTIRKEDVSIPNFENIRFAYAILGRPNALAAGVTGISINTLSSIKNQIDSKNTCKYSINDQKFINTQLNHLTENELNDLKISKRKNANQTYFDGLNYLNIYWSSNKANNANLNVINEETYLISAFLLAITLIGLIGFGIIRRKKTKIRKLK